MIRCNDCEVGSRESCNYNGVCGEVIEMRCECRDGFFGAHCEFSAPCDEIRCELCVSFAPGFIVLFDQVKYCMYLIVMFNNHVIQLKKMKTLHSSCWVSLHGSKQHTEDLCM
jgi:hypothetical protein